MLKIQEKKAKRLNEVPKKKKKKKKKKEIRLKTGFLTYLFFGLI